MKHLPLTVAACLAGLIATGSAHGQGTYFLGKSVTNWRKELTDPQAKVRRSAAFALGKIGDDARTAVPDLVTRIRKDDEASVRDMAASAVGDITKAIRGRRPLPWEEVKEALLAALKDGDARVRRSAAYALGTFGPEAAVSVSALRGVLQDKDATVRQNGAWALGQIGKDAGEAVEGLCVCLTDKDALVRRDAASALGGMGKAGVAGVESLIGMAKSERDEVARAAALDALAHLAGPQHVRFAPGLGPLVANKDPETALGAAIVLARIGGPEAAAALPVLRKALKNPDAHVQEVAAAALANLGPAAEPAVFDLADALTKSDNPPIVRRNAALAIGHIGAGAKPVVPAVVQALKSSEPAEVRQYAAEALAQMQYPANEKAIPAILDCIEKDTDGLVRQKCVWSLFDLRDLKRSGADRILAKVLDEKSVEMALVRYDAARKLAYELKADAPDKTADVLLDMLNNKTLRVYNSTDAKVEGTRTEASQGTANVQANLGGDARYMAVQALGWLGAKGRARKDVVEALNQAAKEEDPKLRDAAKKALEELGVK